MFRKLLIIILLAACALVWVSVFEAEPKDKPRQLTPAEQKQAGGWKRKGE